MATAVVSYALDDETVVRFEVEPKRGFPAGGLMRSQIGSGGGGPSGGGCPGCAGEGGATIDTAVVSAHDDPVPGPPWVSTAFRRRKPATTALTSA
jgi:hypothetical protein